MVVAIVFGGRYNTGTDWENYKDYFDDISRYPMKGVLFGSLEPLYVLLNKIVAICGFGSSAFFAIIAIFQFSVVYILFKEDRALVPYALFFYTVSNLSLDMNIVRQTLAMSLVFLSSKYITGRKLRSAILLTIAIGFHYSAVICLPILFIDSKIFKFLDKTSLVVALYFISIIFATLINQYLAGYIQLIEFGDKYTRNANNLDEEMALSTGYGIIAKHMLNLTLLFFWTKVRCFVNKPFYISVYRVTVLGFILFNISGISVYLSRLALYYVQFYFIVWTVICYTVFHNKSLSRCNIFVYGTILLYLLMFIIGIYHGDGGVSPYTFKWI